MSDPDKLSEERKKALVKAVEGWAKKLMDKYKDIPLTPEQERSAILFYSIEELQTLQRQAEERQTQKDEGAGNGDVEPQ